MKATHDDFMNICTELRDSFDFLLDFNSIIEIPIKDNTFVRIFSLPENEDTIDWFQQECTRLNILNEFIADYWIGGYPSCPIIHQLFYTEGNRNSLIELCDLVLANNDIKGIDWCPYDELLLDDELESY
jgi:hypothetical protein